MKRDASAIGSEGMVPTLVHSLEGSIPACYFSKQKSKYFSAHK